MALPPLLRWWDAELLSHRLRPHQVRLQQFEAVDDWRGIAEETDHLLRVTPGDEELRLYHVRALLNAGNHAEALDAASDIAAGRELVLAHMQVPVPVPPTPLRPLHSGQPALTYITASTRTEPRIFQIVQQRQPPVAVGEIPAMGTTSPAPPATTQANPLDVAYALLRDGEARAAEDMFQTSARDPDVAPPHRRIAWVEAGELARQDGRLDDAITDFREALALAPGDDDVLQRLGYAELAAGYWEGGADHLALSQSAPQYASLAENIAYAYKAAGRAELSAEWFRNAIDAQPDRERTDQLRLKQEVEWLDDRLDLSFYTAIRDNAVDGQQLAPLERSVLQSQGGIGLSYIPRGLGNAAGSHATLSGRLLWSYAHDLSSIHSDSLQAALGITGRPLPGLDLILAVERLVAVGDFARDDWMLRAGYGWSHGLDPAFLAGSEAGWALRLYGEAALIDPTNPDILASGNMRLGRALRSGPAIVIWPHVGISSQWQEDDFGNVSLVEAGPGVTAFLPFGERRYRAFQGMAEVSLQYLQKLTGSSAGASGLLLTVGVTY